MNLNEIEAAVQRRVARGTKPWMRVMAGILLLVLLGLLIHSLRTSPAQIQKRNATESVKFGEALERSGIPTQPGSSK